MGAIPVPDDIPLDGPDGPAAGRTLVPVPDDIKLDADASPQGAAGGTPAPTMSTGGYIAARGADGLLDLGRAGATEADMFAKSAQTGQTDPTADAVLSAPQVTQGPAPNAAARYAGDAAYAFGNSPILGPMMPLTTLGGSVGGTLASDANKALGLNAPDWLARLAGNVVGGFLTPYAWSKLAAARAAAPAPKVIGNTDISINPTMAKNLANTQQFEETPLGQLNTAAAGARATVGDASDIQTTGQGLLDKAKAWLKARSDEYGVGMRGLEAQASGPADFTASGNFATTYPRGPKAPGIVSEYAARVSDPAQPPPDLAELNRWYTRANELIESNDSNAGSRQGLGAFKDALRQDMRSTLTKQVGSDAADAMDNLRANYKGQQDVVRKAFGSLPDETTTPEEAFNQLAADPVQNLTKLKALASNGVLGENDIRAIADSTFRNIGYNSDGVFDPTKFTQNLIALRAKSPQTVDFLFRRDAGAGGPQAAAFDNLMQTARDAHLASGTATQAQTQVVKNAAIEFAKRTGRAAALGTLGRMIPGAGEAGELALTLGGMGEGAPSRAPALLQVAPPPAAGTDAARAFLQSLVTAPSQRRSSE